MERRRIAWLLAIGLTAAGGVAAHTLAYEILGGSHVGHVARGGHWNLCLAVCGSVAVIGLAASRLRAPPLWLFGLMPPVGFALQAHLEWALLPGGGYAAAFGAALLVGVFVQIPFAAAAFLAARGLLALRALIVRGAAPRRRRPALPLALPSDRAPVLRLLGCGCGQRAPPLRLA